MIRSLMLAVVLAVTAATAGAQPAPPAPPGPPAAAGVNVQRREAIKRKIRALRAATLVTQLQLDDTTAGKLFPALARWDDVTDKLLAQRVDLARRMRAADTLDARSADRLIDEAIANQKAFWELEDKRLAELRKILTPSQTARLLVVLPEFERKIQNQLKRAIQKPRFGPASRGPKTEDLDDDVDDDLEPGEQLPARQTPRPGPAKQAVPGDLRNNPYANPRGNR